MASATVRALASELKVLSDENRLSILSLLGTEELCVCHIYESLGLPQNLVSHHLRVLRKVGLVIPEKKGKWIFYKVDASKLENICSRVSGLL